jgi:hypothetical protein
MNDFRNWPIPTGREPSNSKTCRRTHAKARRIRQDGKSFEQELAEDTEEEHLNITLFPLFPRIQTISFS